jgi:ribonuclease III
VSDLDALQVRLGWKFRDLQWLHLALTHPSVVYGQADDLQHNQRLEFLGDAVLSLVLTRELFERFPDFGEGPLTKARAQMVNRHSLAEQARRLGVGEHLMLSHGEEASGGRQRPSALADAFEALLGAVFMEGGFEAARACVLRCYQEYWGEFAAIPRQENPKGELQELLQARSTVAPRYLTTSVSGPDHDRVFECAVHHQGLELGRGRGKSKKSAESLAALAALTALREQAPSPPPATPGPGVAPPSPLPSGAPAPATGPPPPAGPWSPASPNRPLPEPGIESMNGKERVLACLGGQPVDRLPFMPITMMFAAAQTGVKYGAYVRDHRVLVEAQMRIAERFDIDHVSVISDPAREAADCGARLEFFDDQPPALLEEQARLTDKTNLVRLKIPDPLGGGRMTDRVQGVALFKEKLAGRKLIEGWIEGPCAEAADLRGINNLMLDFFDDPAFVRDLFAFVLELELGFAKAQVDAGVDILGVGDAAASLVGPQLYEEFVWPYEKKMVDALHAMGARVRLHICGNTRSILQGMGRLGCEIVDLDFPVPLSEARASMGPKQVLLGNIDPVKVLRDGTRQTITGAIAECHRQAGQAYIVSAGCEVPRDTEPDHLLALLEYARAHR